MDRKTLWRHSAILQVVWHLDFTEEVDRDRWGLIRPLCDRFSDVQMARIGVLSNIMIYQLDIPCSRQSLNEAGECPLGGPSPFDL